MPPLTTKQSRQAAALLPFGYDRAKTFDDNFNKLSQYIENELKKINEGISTEEQFQATFKQIYKQIALIIHPDRVIQQLESAKISKKEKSRLNDASLNFKRVQDLYSSTLEVMNFTPCGMAEATQEEYEIKEQQNIPNHLPTNYPYVAGIMLARALCSIHHKERNLAEFKLETLAQSLKENDGEIAVNTFVVSLDLDWDFKNELLEDWALSSIEYKRNTAARALVISAAGAYKEEQKWRIINIFEKMLKSLNIEVQELAGEKFAELGKASSKYQRDIAKKWFERMLRVSNDVECGKNMLVKRLDQRQYNCEDQNWCDQENKQNTVVRMIVMMVESSNQKVREAAYCELIYWICSSNKFAQKIAVRVIAMMVTSSNQNIEFFVKYAAKVLAETSNEFERNTVAKIIAMMVESFNQKVRDAAYYELIHWICASNKIVQDTAISTVVTMAGFSNRMKDFVEIMSKIQTKASTEHERETDAIIIAKMAESSNQEVKNIVKDRLKELFTKLWNEFARDTAVRVITKMAESSNLEVRNVAEVKLTELVGSSDELDRETAAIIIAKMVESSDQEVKRNTQTKLIKLAMSKKAFKQKIFMDTCRVMVNPPGSEVIKAIEDQFIKLICILSDEQRIDVVARMFKGMLGSFLKELVMFAKKELIKLAISNNKKERWFAAEMLATSAEAGYAEFHLRDILRKMFCSNSKNQRETAAMAIVKMSVSSVLNVRAFADWFVNNTEVFYGKNRKDTFAKLFRIMDESYNQDGWRFMVKRIILRFSHDDRASRRFANKKLKQLARSVDKNKRVLAAEILVVDEPQQVNHVNKKLAVLFRSSNANERDTAAMAMVGLRFGCDLDIGIFNRKNKRDTVAKMIITMSESSDEQQREKAQHIVETLVQSSNKYNRAKASRVIAVMAESSNPIVKEYAKTEIAKLCGSQNSFEKNTAARVLVTMLITTVYCNAFKYIAANMLTWMLGASIVAVRKVAENKIAELAVSGNITIAKHFIGAGFFSIRKKTEKAIEAESAANLGVVNK